MPLPTEGTLSLQGHSKPGDTQFSKPRQGMIVRLTQEMLERLQSLPPPRTHESGIKVDFGDTPGIHIGDEFYATRVEPEAAPHELYMKQANKPLRLHANIVGKVLFVDRKLGERVQSSVRERTEAAEKQRAETKIKMLDAPLALANPKVATKKRKVMSDVRKASAVSTPRNLSVLTSAQPSRVPSPRPSGPSMKALQAMYPSTRQRLIHFIALQSRTEFDVHRLVGGPDASENEKTYLSRLLVELAEHIPVPKGSSASEVPRWQLKNETWLEVRPYEMEKLEDDERTRLCRQARNVYNRFKIPESDSVWQHVRYREPNAPGPSSGGHHRSNGSVDLKRSSTAKGKAEGKKGSDIIVAKDEGARVRAERAAAAADSAPSRRKGPGSGFRVGSNGHTPTPPADVPPTTSQPLKRPGIAVVREIKRETPVPSSSRSTHPPLPPSSSHPDRRPTPIGSVPAAVGRIPKKNRDAPSRPAESDRESRRGSPLPSGMKRKKPRDDSEREPGERDASPPKRRKVEEAERSVPPSRAHAHEAHLPKKPVTSDTGAMAPPRTKQRSSATPSLRSSTPIGRSPAPPAASPRPPLRSPLPPKPTPPATAHTHHPDRLPSVSSTTSHRSREEHGRNGSAKPRRKSPIYTSSEDESDSQRQVVIKKEEEDEHEHKPLPRSLRPLSSHPPAPLPGDEEGLVRAYRDAYPGYIMLYHKRKAVAARMDELLHKREDDDPASVSCEESDLKDLNPEAVRELHVDFGRAKDKLEGIRDAYERLTTKRHA